MLEGWAGILCRHCISGCTGEDIAAALACMGEALESEEDSFVADLEQCPATGPRCGKLLSTLLTHGTRMSFHKGRPMAALEKMQAQGAPDELEAGAPTPAAPASMHRRSCSRFLAVA